MKFPRGKGFDLACGVVVTVVLNTVVHDELVTLTGTFLGEIEEKHHHRRSDDFHEFILLQLTCPFCERGRTKIPEGTFVSINIDQILFTIPGRKCHDKKHDDKWCDKCHDKKHDDKCHDQDDDECHDNWCDKFHEQKHVININCERDDDKTDNDKCDDK
jgi:hypothetical protein